LNLAIDVMKKVKEALIVTEEKKAMSKNRKRRTRRIILYPLFVIDTKYSTNDKMFIFEPSRDSFYAFIDSVINKAHKDISKVTVLSSNEAFKEYMVARSDESKEEEESNIFSKITAHSD